MKSWSFFVLSFSPWLDGTKNTLENGSKYGSPETWTIEKKTFSHPSSQFQNVQHTPKILK
jgi:hypothetical protein